MADANAAPPVEPSEATAVQKDQPETVEQLREKLERVVAHNTELLGDLKKHKNKLSTFESAADKDKEAKLKEEGKLKELLDKKEGEIKAVRDRARHAELKAAARLHGLVDDEYIEILAKQVEFDENDIPTNVGDVFKDLQEKKPYLFKQPDAPVPPGTANRSASGWRPGGKNFTQSEVDTMSPAELDKAWPEILKQMQAGLIK
jgi:hypothetical protein